MKIDALSEASYLFSIKGKPHKNLMKLYLKSYLNCKIHSISESHEGDIKFP
jgi:hypothetical protein